MMRALALCFLAVSVAADKPWFCHDEDCPSFEVTGSTDEYEIRKYAPSKWASTVVEGSGYDVAMTKGFASLYKYFSGNNVNSTKMDMTTPVSVELHASAGNIENNFTVSFFLPQVHQASPPLPKEGSGIVIDEVDEFTAYVLQYGGFTSESKIAEKASELLSRLEDDGKKACSTTYFALSYDPPYRLTHRHNEVLLVDEKDAKGKCAEAAQARVPFSRTSITDVIRQVV